MHKADKPIVVNWLKPQSLLYCYNTMLSFFIESTEKSVKTWCTTHKFGCNDLMPLGSTRSLPKGVVIYISMYQDHQVFKWSDGWPTVYTNWDYEQPNMNLSDHNCVDLRTSDGRWASQQCDELRAFICKHMNGECERTWWRTRALFEPSTALKWKCRDIIILSNTRKATIWI